MEGKTALVTGASGGIGLATALGLAERGAHVAIVGRDHRRLADAASAIDRRCGGVQVFVADLSSKAEVRRLAAEVLLRLPRLDVLVNNAGGYWNTRPLTADGLERTFALNHLAQRSCSRTCFSTGSPGPRPRVSSRWRPTRRPCRIDFDDLQGSRSYAGARAYNQSRFGNVLFTYELARRLQGKPVTANALHPGVVSTSFGSEDPARLQRLWSHYCGR